MPKFKFDKDSGIPDMTVRGTVRIEPRRRQSGEGRPAIHITPGRRDAYIRLLRVSGHRGLDRVELTQSEMRRGVQRLFKGKDIATNIDTNPDQSLIVRRPKRFRSKS